MIIKEKLCYSKLLWIMCAGPVFSECISNLNIIRNPNFAHEGMAGYIETEVEFTVTDLAKFANLYESYYTLSDKRKLELYGLAKGLGDCK
jgi:hypothetical protein